MRTTFIAVIALLVTGGWLGGADWHRVVDNT
jgi:hypothetical protein